MNLDFRFVLRLLARHKTTVAAVVLCLAAGLGGSTFVFGLVNAIRFAALPYPRSDRLVYFTNRTGASSWRVGLSLPNARDIHASSRTVGAFALGQDEFHTLRGIASTEDVKGTIVDGDFFAVFQVPPLLGRSLSGGDEEDAAPAIVLGYNLWRRLYGGDSAIVGRVIRVDSIARTVIGVMPQRFDFPLGTEFWVRMRREEVNAFPREGCCVFAVGRLKDGASIEDARADAQTASERLALAFPHENRLLATDVRPLRDFMANAQTGLVTDSAMFLMFILLSLSIVTAIALVLRRDLGRLEEFSLRAALGASKYQLLRPAALEALFVSLGAGFVGVSTALVLTKLIQLHYGDVLPSWDQIGIDWHIVVFASVTIGLAAVSLALVPAWSLVGASRQLMAFGRGTRKVSAAAKWLVVFQIALATAFVSIAVSVAIHTVALSRRPLGFRPSGLVRTEIVPHAVARRTSDFDVAIQEAALAARSIRSRGVATLQLRTLSAGGAVHRPDAAVALSTSELLDQPQIGSTSPEFFQVIGASFIAGRSFTADEYAEKAPVAVITQRVAQTLFRGAAAVGGVIEVDSATQAPYRLTVIGVVNDINFLPFVSDSGAPIVVSPALRSANGISYLFSRAAGSTSRQARAIDSLLALGDRNWSSRSEDMGEWYRRVVRQRAQPLWLLLPLAAFGLLVTTLGVYSMVGEEVTQRSHELAVRIALGATSGDIRSLLVERVMRYVAFGCILAVPVSALLWPVARSLHRDVADAHVFASLIGIAVVLIASAVGTIPAFVRAVRTPPAAALRFTD
jgi:putative ABC transport system permease protein